MEMDKITGWRGIANYKGALYDVAVVAPAGSWVFDAMKAVKGAGGFCQSQLEGCSVTSRSADRCIDTRVAYEVRFIPNPRFHPNSLGLKEVVIYLRKDFSRVRDGDFQKRIPYYPPVRPPIGRTRRKKTQSP